jgi:hypothetical protein
MRQHRLLEAVLIVAVAAVLTVASTYPLAFQVGRVGRIDTGDGQWSIWVVAWVAHALLTDPLHVFDANIFYPHQATLAYSESNLVPGALAAPVYWATGNPYAAHNVVVLLSFGLALAGAYALVRYLTRSRTAAAVAAPLFAFCPYTLAHTPHIQLLITAGLPFTLLAFHAMIDRPGWKRGLALGLSLALTGLSCGYYGVFGALLVGVATCYYFAVRRLWTSVAHYLATALAAACTCVLLAPFLAPYVLLGEGNRPHRRLADANVFSAGWQSWLASGGWGDRWMLPWLGDWTDVLFPGFVLLLLAGVGAWSTLGTRARRAPRPGPAPAAAPDARMVQAVGFYLLMALTWFWMSFGPKAGLYALCYGVFPPFSLLRVPTRAGIVVVLALVVLGGAGASYLLRVLSARGVSARRRALAATLVGVVSLAELAQVPLGFRTVPPVESVYRVLATLPRGPVLEMPFFRRRNDINRHTYYMRSSTAHWYPLINGYSDLIPSDFFAMVDRVALFPTQDSFDVLRSYSPRYVVFHLNLYYPDARPSALQRIAAFRDHLRPLASGSDTLLFEIVDWPAAGGSAGAK